MRTNTVRHEKSLRQEEFRATPASVNGYHHNRFSAPRTGFISVWFFSNRRWVAACRLLSFENGRFNAAGFYANVKPGGEDTLFTHYYSLAPSIWNHAAPADHTKRRQAQNQLKAENRAALKNLKKDQTNIILPTDKCQIMIIMDRSQYIQKDKEVQTYILVNTNSIQKLDNQIKRTLSDLTKKGQITKEKQ